MQWLTGRLDRRSYVAIGVALMLVKIGVDFGVSRAFGRPYSVLFYVSPFNAPLLHPRAFTGYWLTLAATTLPFALIGFTLTLRRLRDAEVSPWFALLFFVPFANLLFFLVCSLLPSRPAPPAPPKADAYRAPGAPPADEPRAAAAAPWVAGALGSVIGLGTCGVSIGLLKQYGVPLLIGSPVVSGFATGIFYTRLRPGGGFRGVVGATVVTGLITYGVLTAFAIEGLLCIVVVLPVYFVGALTGASIGYFFGTLLDARGRQKAAAGALLTLPALFVTEAVNPLPPADSPPFATSIVVDAPADVVWRHAARMSDLPAPTELAFRLGIAYPVWAELDREGVGARRTCEFTTGTALETVDVWEPGRELDFVIDRQPDPMRELTLWNGPRQPHLDSYVRNLRGRFVFEALSPTKTRLTGTSWYAIAGAPEPYWRFFTEWAIAALHHRVLGHIKKTSEADAHGRLAEGHDPAGSARERR